MTYLLHLVACLFLCVSLNSFGALLGRDLDGNLSTFEAYYDDIQDITWLANANANDGKQWFWANYWADEFSLGGYDEWRLPSTSQPDSNCDAQSADKSFNYNCIGSEMGHLFYITLGNTPSLLTNTGPFSNVQPSLYWSSTELATNNSVAWAFIFSSGQQFDYNKTWTNYAWPVHDGDIGLAPVPLPAGIYLFLSGLVGLGLMRGRMISKEEQK